MTVQFARRRSARLTGACLPLILAVSGAAGGAAAQSFGPGEDPGGTDLGEIVVTAAGFEQQVRQAPASISLIPRDEIQQQRASSIAEILSGVEGVDTGAAVGKSGGQTINIRGMGSDY